MMPQFAEGAFDESAYHQTGEEQDNASNSSQDSDHEPG